jgi:Sec-independent protein translocase protein TatA
VFGLSAGELVVLAFLFAIIAGAPRLPALGERLGELIGGFRRARRDEDRRIEVRPRDER